MSLGRLSLDALTIKTRKARIEVNLTNITFQLKI
jgi:hypothetical protein